MNKLSKDKRDKLLLVCIAVVAVISVLYFFIITDMKDEIATLNSKITATRDKRDKSERVLKMQGTFSANLEELRKALDAHQSEMPRPGQDHVWFLNTIENRRTRYNLDIADIKNPEPWDPGVLPKFPFKAIAFNVTLVGGYTDFGRFLADFENSYPYLRTQIISVMPDTAIGAGGSQGEDTGKLRFNFRVISLIKTQT
jgi:Tfp pilus assembly protein PilO